MKPFLYDVPLLPEGFRFPESYLGLAKKPLPDLEPWEFMMKDMMNSLSNYGYILDKYPQEILIPFAVHVDSYQIFDDDPWAIRAYFDGRDVSGNP